MMNFVVMTVYWSMLHAEQVRTHQNDPGVGHGRVIHMKLAHSVPGIVCLINSSITPCKLKPDFWKLISGMVGIYGSFIFSFWLITGRIQYSFLDFNKGYSCLWILLGINVGATFAYQVFCMIDAVFKKDLRSI